MRREVRRGNRTTKSNCGQKPAEVLGDDIVDPEFSIMDVINEHIATVNTDQFRDLHRLIYVPSKKRGRKFALEECSEGGKAISSKIARKKMSKARKREDPILTSSN